MTLVSDNIRYLRKLNGLTQEQFSRKINIKRSLLGAYEEGRANPNQQNIQAIAKAFNTTVELLTRQDLRKLRETPNLSIPLGQSNKAADTYFSRSERHIETGPAIRSDGKLTTDDDPFQHPDFPDIFAQPAAPVPEPQPLSSVLNKYYKTQEEPRRPATIAPVHRDNSALIPPVITSPVRPGQERPSADHLFDASDYRPGPQQSGRQAESLTFNNVYEEPASNTRSSQTPQSVAPTIPVVMQRQFTEYGQRHQQADFLHRLPAMHLPTLPEGHYRAFEAGDDFAFPGALLVGKFIRNWFDIADGKLYVLLLQPQRTDRSDNSGIFCRRVYNQVKVKGTLLLTADRTDIPNREIALKDVLEVWEICAFVSQQLPAPAPNTDRLRQLVDELKFEVERF
ncbi:helix-turn-helix domain-containing protein [Spirosoma validum]|uniref:Helix-turn-helix transcriptional regulator n=1 Tax=Spirosoma validum TaxID=2771355 RepID=A0A927GE20_9BACT|nr:helix-turn-helix transcriptional regulator [Spirosoma validum]MBD2754314.1 helix-turn-helix transcriptional regulator [Spirosoma validum]